jgi:hypothetical protein
LNSLSIVVPAKAGTHGARCCHLWNMDPLRSQTKCNTFLGRCRDGVQARDWMTARHSSGRLPTAGFFVSCLAASGNGAACCTGAACGSASGLLWPSRRFLRATYCGVGRGGVFAHAGTMSSTLLLAEQAASRVPKISNTTRRIMAGLDARQSGQIWARNARGIAAELPIRFRPPSDQQSRRCQHDPRDDRGQTDKQQKIIEDSDHRSPPCTAYRGFRTRRRPGAQQSA